MIKSQSEKVVPKYKIAEVETKNGWLSEHFVENTCISCLKSSENNKILKYFFTKYSFAVIMSTFPYFQ